MQRTLTPPEKAEDTQVIPDNPLSLPKGDSVNVDLSDYVPGSAEEKAFVRKLDIRLFPAIWWVFVFHVAKLQTGMLTNGSCLQADV